MNQIDISEKFIYKQADEIFFQQFQHSCSGHLWLPTPHCEAPVLFIGRHATSEVTSTPHPTLLPRVLRIWESVFYSQAFFTLHSFLLFSRLPWKPAFNLKITRVSSWSSKHSPGWTICLNHRNPQKVYTGRFYLRARAGKLRNINLYEMFASRGIWILFTVGEYVKRHFFYPFGHSALHIVINFSE